MLDIINNSQGCKFLETTKGGTIDMFDSITMEKSTNNNIYTLCLWGSVDLIQLE